MFLALLTLISGIVISIIAAGYSIIGLATLFAGAAVPIMAMGGALEIGKLVTASWLYRNWRSELLPKTIKYYLTSAVVVLIFITSMGIFGFLSKAHLDQVQPTTSNDIKIKTIDNQINRQQIIIDRSEKTLQQLDKSIEVYLNNDYATRGLRERKKQEEERKELNTAIKNASDEIAKLSDQKANLQLAQDKIEAEVGPIKYIAELIYGDDAKSHFDEAVRIVILILIFVFDPLAVLMLIAANISIREWQLKKESKKIDQVKSVERKLNRLQKRHSKIKSNSKEVEKLLKQTGLSPDEIRLKLNQIIDLEPEFPNNEDRTRIKTRNFKG